MAMAMGAPTLGSCVGREAAGWECMSGESVSQSKNAAKLRVKDGLTFFHTVTHLGSGHKRRQAFGKVVQRNGRAGDERHEHELFCARVYSRHIRRAPAEGGDK